MRSGVYLVACEGHAKVRCVARVKAKGCGRGATGVCASCSLVANERRVNRSTTIFFRGVSVDGLGKICGRLVISPADLGRGMLTLVSRRVTGNRGKEVVVGVGSIASVSFVHGMARTSRTKIGVSLVIHKVYYVLPKVGKEARGLHIADVIKECLRRPELFIFKGKTSTTICVKSTSVVAEGARGHMRITYPICSRRVQGHLFRRLRIVLSSGIGTHTVADSKACIGGPIRSKTDLIGTRRAFVERTSRTGHPTTTTAPGGGGRKFLAAMLGVFEGGW